MNVLSNQNATLVNHQQSPPLLSPRVQSAALNGGHSVLFRVSEPEEETALISGGRCAVTTNGSPVSAARTTVGLVGGAGLFTIGEQPPTAVSTQLSTSSNGTRGLAAENFIGFNGGVDASAGAHSAGSSASASSASNSDASNTDSQQLNNLNNSAMHTEIYQNLQKASSTPKRSLTSSPDALERFRLQNSFSGILRADTLSINQYTK